MEFLIGVIVIVVACGTIAGGLTGWTGEDKINGRF